MVDEPKLRAAIGVRTNGLVGRCGLGHKSSACRIGALQLLKIVRQGLCQEKKLTAKTVVANFFGATINLPVRTIDAVSDRVAMLLRQDCIYSTPSHEQLINCPVG